ncbi:MAG: UvrY/SirA/GacA family response regulator transcription factor [Pseudomonadota bacterium]
MINVLLVDDHRLVRTGIRSILEDTPGIKIVAEAETGEQAVDLVALHHPDVVLMDASMPGMGGLEATRKLLRSHPETKIIALTVHGNEPFPSRFLKAGVAGYITKDCGADEMISAVKAVYRGERYIGNKVAQQLVLNSLNPGGSESPFAGLSDREMQVMLMVIKGKKAQEISDQLCISPKTVNTYRYRLFEKLNVESDVELAHLAMRHGVE